MEERSIDTAVIPVAGMGGRMMPFTAATPKFMAGVTEVDRYRPNIDYTLEDCIGANIQNLIFVVSKGGEEHLRRYLGPLPDDLRAQYKKLWKYHELDVEEERRAVFKNMNIEYIEQKITDPYGTAVPLNLARTALSGVKHFAVTGGDDFVWHADRTSELSLAITNWQASGADHALMGKPLQLNAEATKYGILHTDEEDLLLHIDERPPLERIPDNPLANISRYILSGELIWSHLDAVLAQQRNAEQPEYYVTDVINQALKDNQTFYTHSVQGMYFDAGSPQGILDASIHITLEKLKLQNTEI